MTPAIFPSSDGLPSAPVCEFCFVIGRPRSGTTVFHTMLATHPLITNVGEIFNESSPGSYWDFLQGESKRGETTFLPSRSVSNFLKYLERLRESATKGNGRTILVLDVKYDQARSVCPPWQDMNALPHIFSMIRQFGWFVIDIHRTNLVNLSVSNLVAMESKVYHSTFLGPQEKQTAKVRVDVSGLIRDIESTRTSYERLQRQFVGYPGYLKLTYEQMFDESQGSCFTDTVTRRVAELLRVDDLFDRCPKLNKLLSRNIFEHIENVAEVQAALHQKGMSVEGG